MPLMQDVQVVEVSSFLPKGREMLREVSKQTDPLIIQCRRTGSDVAAVVQMASLTDEKARRSASIVLNQPNTVLIVCPRYPRRNATAILEWVRSGLWRGAE